MLLACCPLLYKRNDLLVFLVPFVVAIFGELVSSGMFTLLILPAFVMAVEGAGDRAKTRTGIDPQGPEAPRYHAGSVHPSRMPRSIVLDAPPRMNRQPLPEVRFLMMGTEGQLFILREPAITANAVDSNVWPASHP
jgi:hypothetical protein